jgi:Leucine-rich repeat (LRR) protein
MKKNITYFALSIILFCLISPPSRGVNYTRSNENPLTTKEVLEEFYSATGGDNWINNTNWCTNAPISDWFGLQTHGVEVFWMDLHSNNLNGQIPASFSQLIDLEFINLSNNNLPGPISPAFSQIPSIVTLDLSNTGATGNLPDGFVVPELMLSLYLYNNDLSGEIPLSYGDFSNLRNLALFNNQITGSIPEILFDLPLLNSFNLSGNRLSGSLPDNIGAPQELMYIHLGANLLSGSIPSSIWDNPRLKVLDLGGNQLSGNIPAPFENRPEMLVFIAWFNQLDGQLPAEFAQYCQNLDLLWIGYNQLSGDIPQEFSSLIKMRSLHLGSNLFNGIVPVDPNVMTGLSELWVFNNNFVDIPDLSPLENTLAILEVQNNYFDFADLGPLTFMIGKHFLYSPQKALSSTITEFVEPGESYAMNVSQNDDRIDYTWYHNRDLLSGSSGQEITVSMNDLSDYGIYFAELSHPSYPEMVLQSQAFELLHPAVNGLDCVNAIPAMMGDNFATRHGSWFSFIPSESGTYSASSCHPDQEVSENQGYAYDTWLFIYDGCEGNLLGENDDLENENCSYNRAASGLEFEALAGEKYIIYWSDEWESAGLPGFTFSITMPGSTFDVDIEGNTNVYLGYDPMSFTTLSAIPSGGVAPYTYLWSNGEETSQILVNPDESSLYSLTIFDQSGGIGFAEITVNVIDVRCGNKMDKVLICKPTGGKKNKQTQICVSQNAVSAHLNNGATLGWCPDLGDPGFYSLADELSADVYPNPNNGEFTIDLRAVNEGDIIVKVYSLTGRILYQRTTQNAADLHSIKLDECSPGMYYLSVQNGAELMHKTIIVN